MGENNQPCFKNMQHVLELERQQSWTYETEEFHGICEIAKDDMTIKCIFHCATKKFYDVLMIDGVIKMRLAQHVSVERLAEQLSVDFPDLSITVMGRAKTHGWITSKVVRRYE